MSSQPPSTTAGVATERGAQTAVCAAISTLIRERWGRGPSRSRAHWAGRDAMVVILDDAHTDAERTLIEHGKGDQVLAGRRSLAEIVDADVRRIAREATGRDVRAAISQSSLDPPVSVFLILFGAESPADAALGDALAAAFDHASASRALIAQSEQV